MPSAALSFLNRRRLLRGIGFLVLLNLGPVAGRVSASSVFADAFVAEGDQSGGYVLGSVGSTTAPFQSVQGSGGSTHDLAPFDGTGLLTFNGLASAAASYNALKTASSGAVSNPFYDPNYNVVTNSGVPTAYIAQSHAQFTQTLQYGGTASNYTSIYALRLTGTISGGGRGAIIVDLQHGSEPAQSWFFDADGLYDLRILSSAYVHGAFAQEFTLKISTLYSFDMDTLPSGVDVAGGADFGNTLEFVGVDLRDEQGNLQPPGTITSDSGQPVSIVAVPEPGSVVIVLLASALAMVAIGQSRRITTRPATKSADQGKGLDPSSDPV